MVELIKQMLVEIMPIHPTISAEVHILVGPI